LLSRAGSFERNEQIEIDIIFERYSTFASSAAAAESRIKNHSEPESMETTPRPVKEVSSAVMETLAKGDIE